MAHYRILQGTSFRGGEWAEYKHAAAWARQHLGGFWIVVRTDRYGVPL